MPAIAVVYRLFLLSPPKAESAESAVEFFVQQSEELLAIDRFTSFYLFDANAYFAAQQFELQRL